MASSLTDRPAPREQGSLFVADTGEEMKMTAGLHRGRTIIAMIAALAAFVPAAFAQMPP